MDLAGGGGGYGMLVMICGLVGVLWFSGGLCLAVCGL